MRKLFYSLIVLLAIACGGEKVPSNILSVNEMSKIMWDMMKMDEYYLRITAKDTLNLRIKENIRLYEQVFNSYGIERKKFYDSYHYYEAHPKQFKILIDSIDVIAGRERNLINQKSQSK
ncbi:DUF4296 domain-containing protein [Sediminibacterium sp. TEGAF015]|uniref:DUF4296 domain-containing protein n=1 Tax=Sediminibacterium sp. TEGAF015 TaxID=575378 RepID=UPI0022011F1F|nr:DUF4296 domain-containing protein [Sediminibacterium sp. TEGAF015]BDQ10894.1 hypothetical protein TEGAF0_01110 [Sediminibacterium sp. TEGAF015]